MSPPHGRTSVYRPARTNTISVRTMDRPGVMDDDDGLGEGERESQGNQSCQPDLKISLLM